MCRGNLDPKHADNRDDNYSGGDFQGRIAPEQKHGRWVRGVPDYQPRSQRQTIYRSQCHHRPKQDKLHEQEMTIVRAHERWHSADQVPAVAQAAKDERADTQRAQRRKAPDHLSGGLDRLCASKQEYESRQGAQRHQSGEEKDPLIKMLPIDTPHHGHVALGEVADVRIAPAQSVIYRENASRRIDVGGNVRNGGDLKGVMAQVQKKVDAIHFPLGYRAVLIGEYAERQAASNRLMNFAIAAALGVFLILLGSFGNLRLAILGFLTLPSALVGGLLGAYFTGGVISLGSLVGFLTVFGIAARNCILLINHYQHLEEQEGEPFGPGLVLRGALERLSPILMTATATALALVPLVAAGAIPGHEIEHPMAIVILCGLVTSTMLNLFVVPFIYLHFGASRRRAEAFAAK